jgi:hypothetical protein
MLMHRQRQAHGWFTRGLAAAAAALLPAPLHALAAPALQPGYAVAACADENFVARYEGGMARQMLAKTALADLSGRRMEPL